MGKIIVNNKIITAEYLKFMHLLPLKSREKKTELKSGKILPKYFSDRGIEDFNSYMKKYSTTLILGKCKLKPLYNSTSPIIMAMIKKMR